MEKSKFWNFYFKILGYIEFLKKTKFLNLPSGIFREMSLVGKGTLCFFLDQTIVELYCSAKIYVRRPPNHSNYITPTAKLVGKRVMFWGCIKFSGKNIVAIGGNIISAKNSKLLETHLEIIYLDENFQQDNASCHNSKLWESFSRKTVSEFWKLGPHNLQI